jgi:TolB protein
MALLVGALIAAVRNVPSTMAAFPGQNGVIAFVSNRPVGTSDIFTIDPNGSSLARLTSGLFAGYLSWSADGQSLAFEASELVGPNQVGPAHIYRMAADGTGIRQLTTGSAMDLGPTWSPDGTKIAFHRELDAGIYTINADGTILQRIAEHSVSPWAPTWSPDGTRIAFVRANTQIGTDTGQDIFTVSPDGSNLVRLTSNHGALAPDWSPDGHAILYGNFTSPNDPTTGLWVANSDGTNPHKIPNSEEAAHQGQARWSPDGTKIVFVQPEPGTFNGRVWVMNGDGSAPVDISSNNDQNTYDAFPAWRPAVGGSPPPPLQLVLPDPLTVNATSPVGTLVTYHVGTTGGVAPITITCIPPSNSQFATGTTDVQCVAQDSSGQSVTGTFAVTVLGAGAQLDALLKLLPNLQIGQFVAGLAAKLQAVLASLVAGQKFDACNQLNAFINQVNAKSGMGISQADASALLSDANRIRDVIACP